MLHDGRGRAAEDAVDDVLQHVLGRLLLVVEGPVDEASSVLDARDVTLARHDRHHGHDRRVGEIPHGGEFVAHLSHRGGADPPEDLQDLQFQFRRVLGCRSGHVAALSWEFSFVGQLLIR